MKYDPAQEQRTQRLESATRLLPGRAAAPTPPRLSYVVVKAAHGWTAPTVVRWNGTIWVTADSSVVSANDTLGIVDLVFNANTVRVVVSGRLTLRAPWPASATAQTDYYLSVGTPGALTTVAGGRQVFRHFTNGECVIGGAATVTSQYLLQVTSTGQQLYTGALGTIRGIFNSATVLTTIPTAAPINGNTYTNGLGGAYLVNSNGTLGSEVWLANQPVNPGSGAVSPSIAVPLPQNAVVSGLVAISMPVTAGGFTLVYLPFIT